MTHDHAPEPVNTRLLAFARDFFTWHADHFEDFASETNAQLLCLANDAETAIAEAKAQAKPDAPSYDELLNGLYALLTMFAPASAIPDPHPRVAQARDLLRRAGR